MIKKDIPQLAQAIRQLTLQAYPEAHGNLFESLCRDHFIDALSDSDLRFRVFQAQTKNFDDAVAIAIQMEAFQQAERHRNRRYVREIDVLQNSGQMSDKGVNSVCKIPEKDKMTNDEIMAQLQQLSKAVNELKNGTKPKSETMNKNKVNTRCVCWNCGERGHTKYKCSEPINEENIKRNQELYRQKQSN
jgi:hypothetical protein